MPQKNIYQGFPCHAAMRWFVFMALALGGGTQCHAQQLTVSIPVLTEDVILTSFNMDVELAAGADMPGTGTWKFSGNDEILLTNAAGSGIWFPNVQLLNTVGLRLSGGPMNIRGVFRFGQGIVRTAGQQVVFGPFSSASNARASSHIDGLVTKEGDVPFVFPLGSNGAYHPIELFNVSGGNSAFQAQYIDQGHPDPLGPWFDGNDWPISTCDYWSLERISGTAQANVRMYWGESVCNEVNDNQFMGVARYHEGTWQLLPSDVNTASDESVFTTGNESQFGDFALASTGGGINVLPVELLHFDALATPDGTVHCSWATASETHNDYFKLERSRDGHSWESFAVLEGAGFSNTALHYHHLDPAPFSGQSYYRMRQVDFDGSETVFEPVAVYLPDATETLTIEKVYRNGPSLHLHYRAQAGPVLIEIFDLSGRKLFSAHVQGDQYTAAIAPALSESLYILRMTQSEHGDAAKFKW